MSGKLAMNIGNKKYPFIMITCQSIFNLPTLCILQILLVKGSKDWSALKLYFFPGCIALQY